MAAQIAIQRAVEHRPALLDLLARAVVVIRGAVVPGVRRVVGRRGLAPHHRCAAPVASTVRSCPPGRVNCRASRSRGACSLPAHCLRNAPARRASARAVGSGSACTGLCPKNQVPANLLAFERAQGPLGNEGVLRVGTNDCLSRGAGASVSQLRAAGSAGALGLRRGPTVHKAAFQTRPSDHLSCLVRLSYSSPCGRPPQPSESLHP